jgi:4-diphosphocytidyl-2-C-methyl-D-erythritol kinase
MALKIAAFAKINLALDIIGKRPDNYHEVSMIMQSVNLFDVITIEDAKLGVSLAVDNAELTAGDDNLVSRAAKLLKEYCKIDRGVKITIEKKIPLAAGVAGGSADAAATLLGLSKFWGLALSMDELLRLGAALGSDVPFCMHGGTMLAAGRGEIVSLLPSLPKCYVVLAKPPISISTAWAYGNFHKDKVSKPPDIDAMRGFLEKRDLKGVAGELNNVLETVTINAYPEIASLKKQMIENGAVAALMSGSGPTVFGILETEKDARALFDKLAARNEFGCEFFISETTERGTLIMNHEP